MQSLNGVLCSLKPIAEAKIDPTHPLHYLASQVHFDENFVKAMHAMYRQFSIFTDFFDMKHNWQVIPELNFFRTFRKISNFIRRLENILQ